jgi:hypothetical protein
MGRGHAGVPPEKWTGVMWLAGPRMAQVSSAGASDCNPGVVLLAVACSLGGGGFGVVIAWASS